MNKNNQKYSCATSTMGKNNLPVRRALQTCLRCRFGRQDYNDLISLKLAIGDYYCTQRCRSLKQTPNKNSHNQYGNVQCGQNGSILDGNPVDKMPIALKLLKSPANEAFIVLAILKLKE